MLGNPRNQEEGKKKTNCKKNGKETTKCKEILSWGGKNEDVNVN